LFVYRIDNFIYIDIKAAHTDDDLLENFLHKHRTFLGTKQTDKKGIGIFEIIVIFMIAVSYFPGVENVWGIRSMMTTRTNLLLVCFIYVGQKVDNS
jgi:hypothetical protein